MIDFKMRSAGTKRSEMTVCVPGKGTGYPAALHALTCNGRFILASRTFKPSPTATIYIKDI